LSLVRLGVITGSGTYSLPDFGKAAPATVETRFGSVDLTEGRLGDADVVHVARHEPEHRRLSNHVRHRANILGLRDAGVEAILSVTVCGAVDPSLAPGTLVTFDDLYFPSNRLPDGTLCTLHDEPGAAGRGHWVYDSPFSEPLRAALSAAAARSGGTTRSEGCYGHVDGPRFNTRSEIRALASAGVTAVSQTAGPETVLAGEAEMPFALLGFVTDYANGVAERPTPTEELLRHLQASTAVFAAVLTDAAGLLAADPAPPPVGSHLRFGAAPGG